MNTYEAILTREGKWWMVAVPQIDGLTQARNLAEAPTMAAEYIAAATGQELADISVQAIIEDIGTVHDIPEVLGQIRDARAKSSALERYATTQSAQLAQDLSAAGLTVRDIGAILGVSYQRAAQLTAEPIDDDNGGIGKILRIVEIEPIDKTLTAEALESFHGHPARHA